LMIEKVRSSAIAHPSSLLEKIGLKLWRLIAASPFTGKQARAARSTTLTIQTTLH